MESKKVIKICGVPYTITEHDDIFNADASHFGMIDPVGCEIRINKSLKDPSKQETLCHEITHGILIHIGRTDLSDDETFVQSLGNAIFQSFMPKVLIPYHFSQTDISSLPTQLPDITVLLRDMQ